MKRSAVANMSWALAAVTLIAGAIWLATSIHGLDSQDSLYSVSIAFAVLIIGGGTLVLAFAFSGTALLLTPEARRGRTVYMTVLAVTALLSGWLFYNAGAPLLGVATLIASAWCFVGARRRAQSTASRRAAVLGAATAIAVAAYIFVFPA